MPDTPFGIAAAISVDAARRAIRAHYPGVADAEPIVHAAGYDSLALEMDGWLFKFPRDDDATRRLRTEAALLATIAPAVTMRVPVLTLHEGPPLFSAHRIIPGAHIVTAQYRALNDRARDAMAAQLAQFYAELHRLDDAVMAATGAQPIKPWPDADTLILQSLPLVPEPLQPWARQAIARWADLPPDPLGETYGYFDGHGWNMAFDHDRGVLNGLYDFADSCIGPVHRDFTYSNWIDRDLTRRIVRHLRAIDGRMLDEDRIELLSAIHRLDELGDASAGAAHTQRSLAALVGWATEP